MHGGLSPNLKSLDQIRQITRPTEIPETGILCDLLWADPDKETQGWGENERGVSYVFGADIVTSTLKTFDLDLVCRAHQVCFFILFLICLLFYCYFFILFLFIREIFIVIF